jgi:lysophospholipase L1-like esterase
MGYEVFQIPVPPRSARVGTMDDHPNAKGHQLMANAIAPLILQLLQ